MDGYRMDKTLLTSKDMQMIMAGLRSLDSVSGSHYYGQLMEKLKPGSSNLIGGKDSILIEFLTVDEGLCVQIMHISPFDDEPESVGKMNEYLEQNGYDNDISDKRLQHEIYLSDARKVDASK